MYNWGELAYEGVVGKVRIALTIMLGVLLGREYTLFFLLILFGDWGFVCLFDWGGIAASCQ